MEFFKKNALKIKWAGIVLLTIVAAAHILTSVMGWLGIAATIIGYYCDKDAPQKKEVDEE